MAKVPIIILSLLLSPSLPGFLFPSTLCTSISKKDDPQVILFSSIRICKEVKTKIFITQKKKDIGTTPKSNGAFFLV